MVHSERIHVPESCIEGISSFA